MDDEAQPGAYPVSSLRAYEQVAAHIRGRIVSGDLREGERLPSELEIGRDAQVSRSTVREALRVLEEAGFVERASPRILTVRRAGPLEPAVREATRELRMSNVTFADLHEALLTLDPALSRRAAERAQPADIALLDENLAAQKAALGHPAAWSQLDEDFHVSIAHISGNTPLMLARRPISVLALPTMWHFVRTERMTTAAYVYHQRIMEEIRAGDGEGAAFMTRRHVNDFRAAWEHAGLDPEQRIGAFDGVPP